MESLLKELKKNSQYEFVCYHPQTNKRKMKNHINNFLLRMKMNINSVKILPIYNTLLIKCWAQFTKA